jgi:hypothetical protein
MLKVKTGKDFSVDLGVKSKLPQTVEAEKPPREWKILVAVSSCWKDLASNQAIRDTWKKYMPEEWDLRFFLGDRNFTDEEQAALFTPEMIGSPGTLGNLAPATAKKAEIGSADSLELDEVMLACPDSYLGLPWKTIESLKWALDRKYDGVIRIFVDTYLFPDRLKQFFKFNIDAAGWSFGCGPCPAHPTSHHSCPLGGAAYWLSAKACKVVIDAPVKHWGEDTHVGFALHQAEIPLVHDARFVYDVGLQPEMNRSKFSIHLNDRGTPWRTKLMFDAHTTEEFGRKKFPTWDGTCKRDGTTRILLHPRGPRCRFCGAFV